MKKVIRNLAAITLAGAMMMGTGMTAYAADVTRDGASSFTEGGTEVETGITQFNLIKDYDSKNPTADAPLSKSPVEEFTYTIEPYAVWNAGSTYADATNKTGQATKITKDNMPMLGGAAAGSPLTVTHNVAEDYAKYETSDDKENTGDNVLQPISVPTYETVGDYWYKVTETLGKTTGVIYGSNSTTLDPTDDNTAAVNGGHNRIYYIHVQATETNGTVGSSTVVSNVTMHTTAPDPDEINTNKKYNDYVSENNGLFYKNDEALTHKVNAIENKYFAGDLVIKKKVTGNAGDKDEYFPVTVTFTKPVGTVVNSDITFTAMFLKDGTYSSKNCTIKGQYDTNAESIPEIIHWSVGAGNTDLATATTTFYVKDNTTVTFSNIPYGINYEIKEKKPVNDTYQNKMTFAEESEEDAKTDVAKFDGQDLEADKESATLSDAVSGEYFTNNAVGSISDKRDTVIIENNKVNTIDIGVLLSNTPYIALLGVAGAGAAVLARRKRRIEE